MLNISNDPVYKSYLKASQGISAILKDLDEEVLSQIINTNKPPFKPENHLFYFLNIYLIYCLDNARNDLQTILSEIAKNPSNYENVITTNFKKVMKEEEFLHFQKLLKTELLKKKINEPDAEFGNN